MASYTNVICYSRYSSISVNISNTLSWPVNLFLLAATLSSATDTYRHAWTHTHETVPHVFSVIHSHTTVTYMFTYVNIFQPVKFPVREKFLHFSWRHK